MITKSKFHKHHKLRTSHQNKKACAKRNQFICKYRTNRHFHHHDLFERVPWRKRLQSRQRKNRLTNILEQVPLHIWGGERRWQLQVLRRTLWFSEKSK